MIEFAPSALHERNVLVSRRRSCPLARPWRAPVRGHDDVPQGPHRQPRRDRAAHPARVPRARRRGRRRLQRGRSRVARRSSSPTRPSASARPTPRRSYLSAPGGHLRRPGHRLRRHPPGLRLPVRGRGLRRGRRRPRPDLHRSAGQRPGAVRQQGRHAPAARRPRPADDPGLGRACCATTCTP